MNYFGDSRTIKTIGIIGGLGPETTAEFYLNLIESARTHCSRYPSIIIDSLSFPFSLERDIIQHSKNEEKLLPALKSSVERLNRAGADFIAIPCNTVHVFIGELRDYSQVPIISIIDETLAAANKRHYERVGLLATTKTIDARLYDMASKKYKIDVIAPTNAEQNGISRTITKILECDTSDKDKELVKSVVDSLEQRGAEAVILGCTDLQLILKQKDVGVELIDSMKTLADAVFKRCVNNLIANVNKLV